MNHQEYVAKLDKREANLLISFAKQRVADLEKEKKDAVAMLDAACSGRGRINFYGQDLHVVGGTYYPMGSYMCGPYWEFELENRSKIVINLD